MVGQRTLPAVEAFAGVVVRVFDGGIGNKEEADR